MNTTKCYPPGYYEEEERRAKINNEFYKLMNKIKNDDRLDIKKYKVIK